MYRAIELKNKLLGELRKIYPEQESLQLVNLLFSSVAGIKKTDFILDPDKFIGEEIKDELLDKLGELMLHKPIQYIIGTAYFYGLEVEVNPSVLIPRPETEELVKWIADENNDRPGLKVLDIGTGSGCIILALGKLLRDPDLTAVDISRDALQVASMNVKNFNLKVEFRKTDILDESCWHELGTFDLIVSNPPYVRESEKILMQANVLDYEPPVALFVPDNDPLVYYRAIAVFSKQHLSDDGLLYLEINENLGKEVVFLLEDEGFADIILRKDLQDKDRMIRCNWKF